MEDAVLLEGLQKGLSYKHLVTELPGRTVKQLMRRRYKLNLKSQVYRTGPLTTEEAKQLVLLRDERQLGWTEIAQIMPGRSPQHLHGLYTYRICPTSKTIIPPRRGMLRAEIDQACALRAEGVSCKDVARVMGKTYRSLTGMFRQLDVSADGLSLASDRPRAWTAEEIEDLTALKAQGASNSSISKKLNRPINGIACKWQRLTSSDKIPTAER